MKWRKWVRLAEFWAGVIVLIGLVIRLYQISPALLERVANRQILDAELVNGLYERGLAKLQMYLYGFPLYHWLVVVGYRLLDTTNEVVGRIISGLASVLAAYWLFNLMRLWSSPWLATISLFFFYLASPVNIIMGRSFLVDELTLALSLGAIYYLSLWRKTKQEAAFIGGGVLLALALMSKITFGYVLLPALWLVNRQWKKLGLLGLIVFLPTLAWYVYGKNINQQLNQGTTGWDVWFWFSPRQLLNPQLYINGFVFLTTWVTTPIGFILSLVGLFLKDSLKKLRLFYVWLLAGGIFLLLFNRASISHNYYYLVLVVPMSVMAAQASWQLVMAMSQWRWFIPYLYVLIGLATVIELTMVNPEFLRAYLVYPPYRQIPVAAEKIKAISLPEDVIVVSAYNTGALGYFSARKYYDLWLATLTDQQAVEKLEEYRRQGAKYYVVYSLAELLDKPMLRQYLSNLSLIADEPGLRIYQLGNYPI